MFERTKRTGKKYIANLNDGNGSGNFVIAIAQEGQGQGYINIFLFIYYLFKGISKWWKLIKIDLNR